MMSKTKQRMFYTMIILAFTQWCLFIFYKDASHATTLLPEKKLNLFRTITMNTPNKNKSEECWNSTENDASKLPYFHSTVSTKSHVGTRVDEEQRKRSHFVTVCRFRARLGNNMFQLAALIGIAATHGYTPVIMQQTEMLNIFHPQNRVYFKLENVQTFNERGCCEYDKNVNYLDHTKNWTLSGFHQSWKYFEGAEDTVRKTFTFKDDYLLKVHNYLVNISKPGVVTVGVHVRRGDFLLPSYQKLGYTTAPVSFIRNAMKYFYDMFKNIQFVFASDDPKWCIDNFKDANVHVSPFHEKGLDMALLSSCNHTIITSGTFGWWIGWLSKGKTIYYKGFPKNGSWLENQFNKSGSYDDYYPRDWLGMY